MKNMKFTIITFYQFKKTNNIDKNINYLKEFCLFNKIKGTILFANEGINGTVAGLENSIISLKNEILKLGFSDLEIKTSFFKYMPFNRLKIRFKKEIVTFGDLKIDVEKNTAKHINFSEWNDIINSDDTLLIDVRNNFENKMGAFQKAINPLTKNFSEFKKYVDNILSKNKKKKIAMYCTGGIRCEKASSYMISKGFKNLYQLKGGILKYLENTSVNKSLWNGECFVFDNRVSVKNELAEGTYKICHACRIPLSQDDCKSEKFVEGISCINCYGKISDKKKYGLKERNKQIQISKKKGLYNPYIKFSPSDF